MIENPNTEAGQHPAVSKTRSHRAKKILWDGALAVILAIIAAVAVDVALHSGASRADSPKGCNAAVVDAAFLGAMFRCDDHVGPRREIRI